MEAVVSGIVTSLVVGLAVIFYHRVFIPEVERATFKNSGVQFKGFWFAVHQDQSDKERGITRELFLKINQYGSKITGEYQIVNKFPDKDVVSRYTVTGKVRLNYIVLTYFPESDNRPGLGTLLLKMVGDGQRMEGVNTGLSVEDSEIKSRPNITFLRQS
jgi:hypothetical protein